MNTRPDDMDDIADPIGFWEDAIGRAISDFVRNEIVSAQGAARILGVNPRRITDLIKSGQLPASKWRGRWIIRKADLNLVKEGKPEYPEGRKPK